MKKRLFAMLLVVALSVSMLTVCASAITPSINLERRESDSGDGWFWNGKTQTLVLQGDTIDAPNGIYIDCDATIKVKEDAWIEGFIDVDGDLTIEGNSWLEILAEDEAAITVSDDVYMEEVTMQIGSGTYGIVCGGTFSADGCELYGNDLNTFLVAEEIEIYDTDIVGSCEDSVLFADENLNVEWSYIYGITEGPVVCAGDDVIIEACELALLSNETSAIWAGERIRLRDCDPEFDVYVDDIDDAYHPLFGADKDVNALFYDDDDEVASAIYANTSLSAYSDVFTFIATQEAGEPGDYNDVSRNDWFYDAVEYVSAKGLMIGTGKKTFSPNETVSNAMAWMILARINDAYTMSDGNWYDAAQSFVVTCGLSDGKNPDGAITREAFITMLFKSNGSYCVRDLSVFADAGSISASAVEPMRWAVENGIIKGVDGKLNPKGYMTRAELAEILMRLG